MASEIHVRRYPRDGVSTDDFELVEVPTPVPGPGEILVRNHWTSVDPSLRLRLAEHAPAGYFSAFPLHRAMDGVIAIGSVVESRAAGFEPGDTIWHAAGWRDYSVVDPTVVALGGLATPRVLDVSVAPPQAYLGPLGGMGLTAYMGLFDVAALAEGETVWVSAAAGAVGSLVAQFSKLTGHRTIGSAGSAEKVAMLRDELGLDAGFNYHDGELVELLGGAAPDGIDVYFDNVGGAHLEAALAVLRPGGRVALCGAVSQYESAARGPANLFQATANSLTLRGFRGSSYHHRLAEMWGPVLGWLASGELRYRETVFEGLERAPEALVKLLAGETVGKTLVRIG